ncbi:MAG: ABC transporter ATP-binding protein, partial [Chloroflexota bacterium]
SRLVVMGLVALLLVYGVKAALLVNLAYKHSRFLAAMQSSVANRLFALYLHQPWTFHLQHNSATLIHKTTTEVGQFCSLMTSLLSFVSELLIILGVTSLRLMFEPAGTLGAAVVLSVATWGFLRLTRHRIDAWGSQNYKYDTLRAQHLQQGLNGAKDVKILGREAVFLERFRHDEAVASGMRSRLAAAQQLPRLWYELLAVSGLVILGSVLIWQGNTGPRLLARLGLFAAAAFRLMPSANRMVLTWQSLRFVKPSIDSIHAELARSAIVTKATEPVIEFNTMIELSRVSFCYPGAADRSLDEVTIKLAKGRTLGIIGGSGAGKSTLVDVILGLLAPDSGAVLVDGRDIRGNIRSWQDQIGYVPQAIYLTDDTVAANVAFGVPPAEINLDDVRRALRAAQLDSFVATLPEGLETFVGERGVRLSGGQRQRIGIARALYRDPPILVLDEATSSLDTETEQGVLEAVNELHGSKTLIIVAHRLSTVANCDELIRLEKGRVVKEGTFAEVTSGRGAVEGRMTGITGAAAASPRARCRDTTRGR